MDFTTRQPMAPSTSRFSPADAQPDTKSDNQEKSTKPAGKGALKNKQAWVQGAMMVFLLCLVVLVSALLLLIASGNPNETRYVQANGMQSVQVATQPGQAPNFYYGYISAIDANYLVLDGAYATVPRVGGTNPVVVAPLSCVSPAGSSQLILNRSYVSSWENLSSSGNAYKAIQLYKSTFPNGQCPPTQENSPAESPASPTSSTSGTKQPSGSSSKPSDKTSASPSQTSPSTTNDTTKSSNP